MIGLAPNLFYGTGLAACVVVLRRAKPAERKEQGAGHRRLDAVPQGPSQNFLDPEHAEQIVAWVRAFEDVEDRARVVGLDEIEAEDWTLNISRYVLPPIGEDDPAAAGGGRGLQAGARRRTRSRGRLREVLTEGGWLA